MSKTCEESLFVDLFKILRMFVDKKKFEADKTAFFKLWSETIL